MRALSSPPFGNYRVWWSLAESKYGGTALLVKKHCQPKKVSFSLDRNGNEQNAIPSLSFCLSFLSILPASPVLHLECNFSFKSFLFTFSIYYFCSRAFIEYKPLYVLLVIIFSLLYLMSWDETNRNVIHKNYVV